MHPGQENPRWGPKLCMANACFKHDVLAIPSSHLNVGLEEHSLGVEEGHLKGAYLLLY